MLSLGGADFAPNSAVMICAVMDLRCRYRNGGRHWSREKVAVTAEMLSVHGSSLGRAGRQLWPCFLSAPALTAPAVVEGCS